jgi:molybdopterin-binding protein
MSDSSLLQLKDLRVFFKDFALKNINLEIEKGEYFVLLGPTGAGKTVLLEAIAGIIPSQSGVIELEGNDISNHPPEQRRIGFVYQDYALFPHMTVRRNITFGARDQHTSSLFRYRLGADNHRQKSNSADKISALLKISHLLERKPKTLSGGEKQRVAMARALVTDPRILLLDEPLSSLDPETRETVQIELRKLHQELGTTTLHITHDFEVAAALADRIGLMMEGKIIQIGTPHEIFRQPVDEQAARFVGVQNIFRGLHEVDLNGNGILKLDGIQLATISRIEGIVRASIRPEEILLTREPHLTSARNNFRGNIVQVSSRGSVSYLTVRIPPAEAGGKGLDLLAMVTQSAINELELEPGLEIHAAFKASALHIF